MTKEAVLKDSVSQDCLFYEMCPKQVDVGEKKLTIFDWILKRTSDGFQQSAPREIIHLLNVLKDKQIRHFEVGDLIPDNNLLFARQTFKESLFEVSDVRLHQTLYAEHADLKQFIEALEEERTLQSPMSLAKIWDTSEESAKARAQELVEVGFFEQRGDRDVPQYWVPFLYRDALKMVQGSAS